MHSVSPPSFAPPSSITSSPSNNTTKPISLATKAIPSFSLATKTSNTSEQAILSPSSTPPVSASGTPAST